MQSWPFVGVLPCCGSALERMNANSDDAIFEKRAITCWATHPRQAHASASVHHIPHQNQCLNYIVVNFGPHAANATI